MKAVRQAFCFMRAIPRTRPQSHLRLTLFPVQACRLDMPFVCFQHNRMKTSRAHGVWYCDS